jgi:hypothetical protein
VIDDEAHRRRLVHAGRERVKAFDWAGPGAAMAALYRRLAGL